MSETTSGTTVGDLSAAPPAAPREMTARARRAAWAHPPVRFWWLVAGALVAGMVYLLIAQTVEWSREVRLVREGAAVDAEVMEAGVTLKNRPIPALSNVDVTYTYNGQKYKVTGELPERRGVIVSGQTIPIRVDPENPKVWTNRTEPPALSGKMAAPLLLLPPVAVAVVAGLVLRRRVTGVWGSGEARQAVVVDTKQTPLAPLSRVVRCAVAGDKRLIAVYVPQRFGRLEKGNTIWLVTHPTKPQRAVAAAVFG